MQSEIKDLAIYGAGGLGREVAAMLQYYNYPVRRWRLVGFFDDGVAGGTQISSFGKVLGGIGALNAWPTPLDVALAFGNPRVIRVVRNKIVNGNVSFPNLISPDFLSTDPGSFKIGEGNIIQGHMEVTTDVEIGSFNLFNGSVTLGHDVRIGNFNVLMPGVRVSGEVSIGDVNLLGGMSFVRQQLSVGDGVTLGPLSALLTRPKDNSTYIGNPAKIIKF